MNAPLSPSRKPSSGLMVFAILQIAFGALGLCGIPMTYGARFLALDPVSKRLNEVMWGDGVLGVWTRSGLVVGAVWTGLLIASGIGLLGLKPWARTLSLVYAAGAGVTAIVGQVMSVLYLYPLLRSLAEEYANDPIGRAAAAGGLSGGLASAGFALLMPGACLIIMTRPSVRRQLAAGSGQRAVGSEGPDRANPGLGPTA